MATNRVYAEGRKMPYTASAAIESGDPVVVGSRVGIAQGDIANGASGILDMGGVYELPKANGAISQGALVYWDPDGNPQGGESGAGAIATTSATGNTLAGYAFAAAGATDETVEVKING